ncbi:MAG: preprotein translocase subunit SecG [Candidatus Moraniibacteriota bacterium]
MRSTLLIIQVVAALLLMFAILFQNRGTGTGVALGNDFGSYYAKRGFEKTLHYATIGLAAIFIVLAVVNTLLFQPS